MSNGKCQADSTPCGADSTGWNWGLSVAVHGDGGMKNSHGLRQNNSIANFC